MISGCWLSRLLTEWGHYDAYNDTIWMLEKKTFLWNQSVIAISGDLLTRTCMGTSCDHISFQQPEWKFWVKGCGGVWGNGWVSNKLICYIERVVTYQIDLLQFTGGCLINKLICYIGTVCQLIKVTPCHFNSHIESWKSHADVICQEKDMLVVTPPPTPHIPTCILFCFLLSISLGFS